MAIDIWWWWLWAVYLGDTLIAWWGWGGWGYDTRDIFWYTMIDARANSFWGFGYTWRTCNCSICWYNIMAVSWTCDNSCITWWMFYDTTTCQTYYLPFRAATTWWTLYYWLMCHCGTGEKYFWLCWYSDRNALNFRRYAVNLTTGIPCRKSRYYTSCDCFKDICVRNGYATNCCNYSDCRVLGDDTYWLCMCCFPVSCYCWSFVSLSVK